MSLVQISKLEPCANLGLVVGIDFGTTNSLAAHVSDSVVRIIPMEDDDVMLPSVVLYDGNNVVVGKHAAESTDAVFSIKRLIGGNKNAFLEKFPYFKLINNEENVHFNIHGKKISNIEIASEILKKLKYFSEKNLKESISTAVITVPAYFNNKAKESIKIAAKLAGINAIRLLAEPTAAALAYKIKENGTYLVYDLGGGTFDVSVIDFNKGVFKVLAVGGDDLLGGDDFDNAIVQKMIDDLHISIHSSHDFKYIKALARALKEGLCTNNFLTHTSFVHDKIEYEYELTLEEFNALIFPLVKNTIRITNETIKLANKKTGEINKILLVGGSTKIQIVRDMLSDVFGANKVLYTKNPETLVVEGAAIQAHSLNFGSKTLIIDVTPLSLGIETLGGVMEKIIERNTSIPISKSRVFTTHIDNQTSILINVFQGEREMVKDNKQLIQLELKNIPPMAAGIPKIEVVFTIDENSLLKITAHETTSDVSQEMVVNPNYELTEEEIKKMVSESFINAEKDLTDRETVSAKMDLEKIIDLMSAFIDEDSDLLTNDEYHTISSALKEARDISSTNYIKEIKKHKTNIEKISEAFLEKRFNKYLKKITLK